MPRSPQDRGGVCEMTYAPRKGGGRRKAAPTPNPICIYSRFAERKQRMAEETDYEKLLAELEAERISIDLTIAYIKRRMAKPPEEAEFSPCEDADSTQQLHHLAPVTFF